MGVQEFQKSAEYKKYLAVAKPKAKAAGRKWMEMAGMSRIEVAPEARNPGIPPGIPGKAKAAKKETRPKGPPIPDSMPKKPPKAMALFMAANKGRPAGRGGRSKFGFGM